MKMKKYLLTLICFGTLLAACHDDRKDDPTGGSTTRTVMVYMAGENNLTATDGTRFLRNDLNEIIAGSKYLGKDQRLLIFIDSLNTTKNSGTPVILEARNGQTTVLHRYDTEFYSCDPAKFKDVLQRMLNEAPAKSYGLVLWGHACGWNVSKDTIPGSRTATRAYGQDYGTDMTGGSLKWMNITQMARVLESLPRLEFIFADCCNMMCAEVGYELRNVTNYLIGSPAEIPGDGAPYDMILPYLYKNDSQLYKGIIDTYYDYYLDAFEGDYTLDGHSVPLSVIDTRQMEQLATATRDVIDTFAEGTFNYPQNASLTGLPFYLCYDAPVMYDLRGFIKMYATDEDFQSWDRIYQQAVPYYRMSMKWMTIYDPLERSMYYFNQEISNYGCVSLFIPRNNLYYFGSTFNYNNTSWNFGWNRIIDWTRYGWDDDAIYIR